MNTETATRSDLDALTALNCDPAQFPCIYLIRWFESSLNGVPFGADRNPAIGLKLTSGINALWQFMGGVPPGRRNTLTSPCHIKPFEACGGADALSHLPAFVFEHVGDHHVGAFTREHACRAAPMPDAAPEMMGTLLASLMAVLRFCLDRHPASGRLALQ